MTRRWGKLMAMFVAVIAVGAAVHWLLPVSANTSSTQAQSKSNPTQANSQGNQKGKGQSGTNADAPVPVLAASATTADVPIIVRGIGTVQAFNTVTLRSRVDGNISQVLFTEGQYVHAGDLLDQIDPRPYQAQLEQADANKAKDDANLENARHDLARYSAIVASNLAVTRQQYDTQKALVAQLDATTQSDQAQIDAAKLNVDYASVRSPIDGITGLRLVDVGNLVQAAAATPLVIVTQIQPIAVIFTVPERELDRIRRASAGSKLEVQAFDGDDSKQLSSGTLLLVNNQVDQNTGTVTLKAIYPNADEALWPGEFVNAHLVIDTVKSGVTIPVGAVQMGPTGAFVYVIKPDSTVDQRKVTVTQVESGTALIGSGLTADETIVVSGQTNLAPGVKVAVQQGKPGDMNAQEPEIGPEGVGSTGINTAKSGAGQIQPR